MGRRKKQDESVLVKGCEAGSVLYRSSSRGKYFGLEIQVFEPQEPHPLGVEGKNDPIVGRFKITRAPNKTPYHEIFSHFIDEDCIFLNAEKALCLINKWKNSQVLYKKKIVDITTPFVAGQLRKKEN